MKRIGFGLKPEEAIEAWDMLADLCREAGDAVEVWSENPEGPPYYGITCEGGWTSWERFDYTGDTMLGVLRSACADRTERQGTEGDAE